IGFLTLSIYLAPAMIGYKPAGVIGDNLVAFLPIRTGHEADGPAGGGNSGPAAPGHNWYLDYQPAWEDAVANNKDIFIDFTGTNCSNCRYNEGNVFPLPKVKEELNKFVLVSLYTDTVPKKGLSSAESKMQGERNMAWQIKLAKKDVTLPTYIVFQPARDTP